LLRGVIPVGNALKKAAPAAERVFLDELRVAAPDRRKELLEERVARHVSSILKLPGGRLDPRKPLGSYGLDSIMAIELRNRLERDVALPLSATLIWNYPTVVALAGLLAGKLAPAESEASTVVGAATLATAPVSASTIDPAQPGERVRLEVETLSDDDALAALRASISRRYGQSPWPSLVWGVAFPEVPIIRRRSGTCCAPEPTPSPRYPPHVGIGVTTTIPILRLPAR
jgi:acyl carrier protein